MVGGIEVRDFGFASGEYDVSWQLQARNIHRVGMDQGSIIFCGTVG
jgi:hypothetical protein